MIDGLLSYQHICSFFKGGYTIDCEESCYAMAMQLIVMICIVKMCMHAWRISKTYLCKFVFTLHFAFTLVSFDSYIEVLVIQLFAVVLQNPFIAYFQGSLVE